MRVFWSFVYLFFDSVVEYRVQTMREYDHEFINGFDPNEKLTYVYVYIMVAMVDLLVNMRVLMELGTFQVTFQLRQMRTYGNITLCGR